MSFNYSISNRHLTITNGSTYIPDDAFSQDKSFDTVEIPNTVKVIGDKATTQLFTTSKPDFSPHDQHT